MQSQEGEPPMVLIAERDRNVRKLQQFFLERAGYGVEFADDGQDALDRALLAPPSLVVTEILLPRVDGLALCRRLRDDPRTRDVPVIVFSILAAAGRAEEAGATAFLRKPLVETVFVPVVERLTRSQPTCAMETQ